MGPAGVFRNGAQTERNAPNETWPHKANAHNFPVGQGLSAARRFELSLFRSQWKILHSSHVTEISPQIEHLIIIAPRIQLPDHWRQQRGQRGQGRADRRAAY